MSVWVRGVWGVVLHTPPQGGGRAFTGFCPRAMMHGTLVIVSEARWVRPGGRAASDLARPVPATEANNLIAPRVDLDPFLMALFFTSGRVPEGERWYVADRTRGPCEIAWQCLAELPASFRAASVWPEPASCLQDRTSLPPWERLPWVPVQGVWASARTRGRGAAEWLSELATDLGAPQLWPLADALTHWPESMPEAGQLRTAGDWTERYALRSWWADGSVADAAAFALRAAQDLLASLASPRGAHAHALLCALLAAALGRALVSGRPVRECYEDTARRLYEALGGEAARARPRGASEGAGAR